jgi:peptidyl-tRNA hydrolase
MKSKNFSNDELKQMREQKDPLVMYLIIKKSVKITPGKMGVQCGHATEMVAHQYCHDLQYPIPGDHDQLERAKNYREWLKESRRKILKEASDSKFEQVKEEQFHFLVKDAGLTQLEPGSETIIAVWPMRRSQTPKFIHRMRLVE